MKKKSCVGLLAAMQGMLIVPLSWAGSVTFDLRGTYQTSPTLSLMDPSSTYELTLIPLSQPGEAQPTWSVARGPLGVGILSLRPGLDNTPALDSVGTNERLRFVPAVNEARLTSMTLDYVPEQDQIGSSQIILFFTTGSVPTQYLPFVSDGVLDFPDAPIAPLVDVFSGSSGVWISSVTFSTSDPSPVPLPAAAWLLLSGVGGLGAFARRRAVAA